MTIRLTDAAFIRRTTEALLSLGAHPEVFVDEELDGVRVVATFTIGVPEAVIREAFTDVEGVREVIIEPASFDAWASFPDGFCRVPARPQTSRAVTETVVRAHGQPIVERVTHGTPIQPRL